MPAVALAPRPQETHVPAAVRAPDAPARTSASALAWAMRAPGPAADRAMPASLAALPASMPGDRDEREADQAADQVMRGAPASPLAGRGAGTRMQRKEAG